MNTQTFHKFLLLGLLAAATIAVAPQARATETIGQEVVDGIEWNYVVSDGKATVGLGKSTLTAISTNTAGAVTVPATLGGAPVTAIGDYAFYGCSNVTSFALPGSVTSIGACSFAYCRSATDISVPDAVTNFGQSAFAACSALQQCVIPPLVEELPSGVFAQCVSFREVVVPDTVREIGSSAFSGCTGLENATVRASEGMWASTYTESADGIFSGCSLDTLTISCPNVGNGSLYRCSANRLVLEEGVESIGRYAFWSSRFGAVSFPDSLLSIHEDAFWGYRKYGAAVLPYTTNAATGVQMLDGWATKCVASNTTGVLDLSGVRGILGGCFRNRDYESVSMPDVRVLGSGCFSNCVALQSVYIGNKLQSVGTSPFEQCSRLKEAVLAEGVPQVFRYMFSGCSGLEKITLPNSVRSIGEYAFEDCSALAKITIPAGVTNIGGRAFKGCSDLQSVEIPDGVTDIGPFAFSYCTGLASIRVPASVTNAPDAFYNCGSIHTATLPGHLPLSSMSCPCPDIVVLAEGTTTICDGMFSDYSGLATVTIPAGVTNIGNQAFYNCRALPSVDIPDGVASIGQGAFQGCSGLSSVALGVGMTDIGSEAFYGCSSLASVDIPDGVTSIGQSAFAECSSLTSVSLGVGLTDIGNQAFYRCGSLAALSIPASVASIGDSAFNKCSALQDVHLSDLAAWCAIPFGNSTASPFYYAQNLYLGNELVTALEIPDGVTAIGDYAFYNCDCLESVSIPDSVKAIGNQAFYDCDNLVRVRVPQAVVAKGLASVFRGAYRNLQHLSLGADVDAIGANEFNGFTALTGIDVAEGNPNYLVSADGCLYDAGQTTLLVCPREATAVDLPDGLETISPYAFQNCGALSSLAFPETVAYIPASALDGCGMLWTKWYKTLSNLTEGGGSSGGSGKTVSLTVTNIIVHYVTQSVPSGAVTPSTNSTGIVNIVAEVTLGKAIAISEDWAKQYPGFTAKYGTDFSAALTMPDGKHDGTGAPMYVWQDYVAGTDPTDPASVFTASLTFDAETGAPIISWSPELSPEEAAKRLYTIYGKVRMTDPDWLPIDGDASDYNFYRVTVEMR